MRIYAPPESYLTPDLVLRSAALFDDAEEAVADDATLLHRVRVARLPIIYTQLALGLETGETKAALAARFEETARAEGVTKVAEWGELAPVDAWLGAQRV